MEVLTMVTRRSLCLLIVAVLLAGVFSCRRPAAPFQPERVQSWMDYYGIGPEAFEQVGQYAMPYTVEREFSFSPDDPYAPFYVFSSDATRAIDLDSYHLVLEEREDGSLFSPGREADMEVGLIDLTEGVRKRILFCGPACVFEEAGFDPEGAIVVAGFAENGQGFFATLWIICIKQKTIDLKQAPVAIEPGEIRYVPEKRLNKVKFWHQELETSTDIPL